VAAGDAATPVGADGGGECDWLDARCAMDDTAGSGNCCAPPRLGDDSEAADEDGAGECECAAVGGDNINEGECANDGEGDALRCRGGAVRGCIGGGATVSAASSGDGDAARRDGTWTAADPETRADENADDGLESIGGGTGEREFTVLVWTTAVAECADGDGEASASGSGDAFVARGALEY
jgi:hypothetical protein